MLKIVIFNQFFFQESGSTLTEVVSGRGYLICGDDRGNLHVVNRQFSIQVRKKLTHTIKIFDELQQHLYLQSINWICPLVIQNLWRIGSPLDTHPTDRTLGLRRKGRRIFTQNLRFGKLETSTDSRFWPDAKATLNFISTLILLGQAR